jgi:F-type H+-transporting ATPase subunit b
MNPLILEIAANSGGQVQQIARTFGVDWPHLLAQIISFSIVCFLLYRFAYRPVLAILEQRQRQIVQGIADSKKIKEELTKTEAERHTTLMEAGMEASKIVEEAHAAAAQVKKNEIQKAIAAAQQITFKAQEAAVQERAEMLLEVKREVGLLVVEATTKVTGKILTTDDQRRMAEETVRELPKVA